MQTLNLEVNDSLNDFFAKLATVDFNKDYKLEFENRPVVLTKIADTRWSATRVADDGEVLSEFYFSSAYNTTKEILIDLFETWNGDW